jgi:putative chitinase
MQITSELLKKLCPTSKRTIIDGVSKYLTQYSDAYELNTKLRMAHFLAQAAHESAHFGTLTEYATGQAYEGRKDLGNTQQGDGVRFKGRGIFQVTGRANYKKYGDKIGVDLVSNPALAADPENSVRTALEYWKDHGLNVLADQDMIKAITRKINGGYNGLDERLSYLVKVKLLLNSVSS